MTEANLYEERIIALHLFHSGTSPRKIAAQLKRSEGWVYKWGRRFEQESWAGLQGRSRAPKEHGRV